MHYYTVAQLNYDIIHRLLPQIPSDIDLIVGIPRDGVLVATLISLYRNIPVTDLTSFIEGRIYLPGIKHRHKLEYQADVRRVLLVDDICGTGRSMREAKRQINLLGYDIELICAAVYVFGANEAGALDGLSIERHPGLLDFYAQKLARPCIYEWTLGDMVRLPHTLFDFDGILCPDCPAESDDDGPKYYDFLTKAPLKLRPEYIGVIVTWRDAKYREQTEAWLTRNRIRFGKLIMADRQRWRGPVDFKAFHYKKSRFDLFIESSDRQAKQIAKITGKPILALESNRLYEG